MSFQQRPFLRRAMTRPNPLVSGLENKKLLPPPLSLRGKGEGDTDSTAAADTAPDKEAAAARPTGQQSVVRVAVDGPAGAGGGSQLSPDHHLPPRRKKEKKPRKKLSFSFFLLLSTFISIAFS